MEKQFHIEGMSCGHCVMAVEKQLAKLNLIKSKVNIGLAKIEFNASQVSEEEIKKAIEGAGYSVTQIK